jgi:hypothetical protein
VILEAVYVMQLDDDRKVVGNLLQRGPNLLARQPRRDLFEYHIPITGN